jgi:RNA polymerase sigma-70 factor, ECF subfamily
MRSRQAMLGGGCSRPATHDQQSFTRAPCTFTTRLAAATWLSDSAGVNEPRVKSVDTVDITHWLSQLGSEPQAAQQVYQHLYGELHRAARGHMRREAAGHTLGATALVNEAWLRMSTQNRTQWQDRGHFMAVASTMMRRILVDHAVARRTAKRDAVLEPIDTTWMDQHGGALDHDLAAVHEALLALEEHDPRAAKVVELRFFGGLEVDEVAQALGISAATVKRDWALARAWLRRELGGSPTA